VLGTGPGFFSTDAQTKGGSDEIGYADSADTNNPAALASSSIEIMSTLLGEANLGGIVSGIDFNLLAQSFNQFASQSAVSAADLAALDSFAVANGIKIANVPEPASALMMLMAGLGILRGRRRTSRYTDPKT